MLDVIPWVGLESARFGETRGELRDRLGAATSFVRVPGTPPVDHYVDLGLLLSFDASDRLVFIEATTRARPAFASVELCGRPFGEVVDDLTSRGVTVEIDDSGGVLQGTGIALYTPAPDEPDVEVEAVSLFSAKAEASPSDIPPPASTGRPGSEGEETLF
ncbi:hypothetical protein [Streptomyces sp. NPDC096152]|uniref:hypothetical protein n=1 Tax=Streptomyces sp. NPDC096152 TaxID=3366078 RepID=UPI0037F7F16E